MERVKLITGITYEWVPLMGRDEVPYFHPDLAKCRPIGDAVVDMSDVQNIGDAKVMEFHHSNHPSMLIAWTAELEEAIGVPIKVILGANEVYERESVRLHNKIASLDSKVRDGESERIRLQQNLSVYGGLSLWQRVKYLFTGELQCTK